MVGHHRPLFWELSGKRGLGDLIIWCAHIRVVSLFSVWCACVHAKSLQLCLMDPVSPWIVTHPQMCILSISLEAILLTPECKFSVFCWVWGGWTRFEGLTTSLSVSQHPYLKALFPEISDTTDFRGFGDSVVSIILDIIFPHNSLEYHFCVCLTTYHSYFCFLESRFLYLLSLLAFS